MILYVFQIFRHYSPDPKSVTSQLFLHVFLLKKIFAAILPQRPFLSLRLSKNRFRIQMNQILTHQMFSWSLTIFVLDLSNFFVFPHKSPLSSFILFANFPHWHFSVPTWILSDIIYQSATTHVNAVNFKPSTLKHSTKCVYWVVKSVHMTIMRISCSTCVFLIEAGFICVRFISNLCRCTVMCIIQSPAWRHQTFPSSTGIWIVHADLSGFTAL